ncbi:YEATS-associated helix-containing protein [Aestuariirhabdus sp. LZHN29]|uniref:YEATS-associated helix-containing protein n=1 Tax=Aestuariirhabdus sp. LZHN29 TaxID=3417462 RepID=UPI003CF34332
MDNHFFVLAAVMLVAGAFGGTVNYYLSGRQEEKGNSWIRPVVLGIGASFLVPVVLDVLSIKLVIESAGDPSKLLIFTSICLIAAISSRYLVGSLGDKVAEEAKRASMRVDELLVELRNLQDEIAPLIETETETEGVGAGAVAEEVNSAELDVTSSKVLKTLASGRFIFRSISGLCTDSSADETTLRQTLSVLIVKGLAGRSRGPKGERWYVTERGRRVLEIQ